MKITKQRLKKIIMEELAAITEDDKVSKKIAHLMDKEGKPQKQAVAMALDMEDRGKLKEDWDYEGDDDDAFLDAVQRGEADGAAGRPKNPNQVDRHHTKRYDAAYDRAVEKNTLVLPDAGTAGVEKSRQALKRSMNQRQRQKKLRYKN
jgi:hypothetical protein